MVLTSAAVLYFFFFFFKFYCSRLLVLTLPISVKMCNLKQKKCYRGPNEEHDLLHLSIISSLSCLDPISQVQITCFFFYWYIYVYVYIHIYIYTQIYGYSPICKNKTSQHADGVQLKTRRSKSE